MREILYGVASYGDVNDVIPCESRIHALTMLDRTYGDRIAVNTGEGWTLEG